MSSVELCLVIHNHQPVGNLPHVIEDAYRRAYWPFLELLERRHEVRIALHNSGCLWEWLEGRHPEYGRRVEPLVRRGQIELLGGAFYEPILSIVRERDRRGQVSRMTRFLNERFGVVPRGFWLAERVWEPHLVSDLAAEGVDHLFLDDTQFESAGLRTEDLGGTYLTEDSGATLVLFPIDNRLRYEIPFAPPEKVLETIRKAGDRRSGSLVLFGDDGEKFGVWPGTDRLCYGERWCDRFFDRLLEEKQTVRLVLPSEHRAEHPPLGTVYIPEGSYREMGEWALPPEIRAIHDETRRSLVDQGRERAVRHLLRGGFFRNFLVRYTEAGRMRRRTLQAHRTLDETPDLPPRLTETIRDHFWRAQCNCAYWHGVFGGVYLPHLRDGVYRELLLGERLLDRQIHGPGEWVDARLIESNAEEGNEVLLSSDSLALYLSPRWGGGLQEVDHRATARNLVNSITRRREACHDAIPSIPEWSEGSVRSIHDAHRPKEENLERLLRYDRFERVGLVDRFFEEVPRPHFLHAVEEKERADFAGMPYRIDEIRVEAAARVRFSRRGRLRLGRDREAVLAKTILLSPGEERFTVRYRIDPPGAGPIRGWFGVETVFNLLAGDAPDRFVLIDGEKPAEPALGSQGDHPGAQTVSLVDAWAGIRLDLFAQEAAGAVRAPIETVSVSESGIERVFQGTIVMPYWELRLEAGDPFEALLRIEIVRGRSDGDRSWP